VTATSGPTPAGAPAPGDAAGALPEAEARLAAWLERLQARAQAEEPRGVSWLLVTPLGWPRRAALWAALEAAGACPVARRRLHHWPRLETAVRLPPPEPARLRRALRYEAEWAGRFPGGPGEAWALAPGGAHRRAAALKARLRRGWQPLPVLVDGPGRPPGWLHPFHLADPGLARAEAQRLAAALALLAG
jgi:hypothetical protein